MNKASPEALVLGAGPGALAIAAALSNEGITVAVLAAKDHRKPWPYTYGIWGEEVDELGLSHLLGHRWNNTVSYFGQGSKDPRDISNDLTPHGLDYGLFDKEKLQNHWLKECESGCVTWHKGIAEKLFIDNKQSRVISTDGREFKARIIIDATGYKPVFLKSNDNNPPVAVQTCYGIVGQFNKPPLEKGQFVLMDYRCDHLSKEERKEPPTFLYAMDMGKGSYFLEETSLGLFPPLSEDTLRERLKKRLESRGLTVTKLEHEEIGLYLPMNLPLPNLNQPILGFGGAAAMVHPASGYMVGGMLRRAPLLAKALSSKMKEKNASPAELAEVGWSTLWPRELRRKQALYQFGLEKLMRFDEPVLRSFFISFFGLNKDDWYGFLTNTLNLSDLVKAMWRMFIKAKWNVKLGLMIMHGRELKLLWRFIKPVR